MAVKQALDVLRELEDGKVLNDLSVDLNELIRQVRHCNKAGSINLQIKINPVNNDTHNVTAEAAIKVSAPKLARKSTLFYTTPDCNLSRTDPAQRTFPGLESLDGGRPDIEKLDEAQPKLTEA
ncbi:MAG: hypothetical protein ACI9SP_001623 [Arenicella sp.]|jgi:hypothetical protein